MNPAGGPPQEGRETAAEPTAHTSPSPPSGSAAHLPGSAGRASWPSDPAEDCAASGGGRPAPREGPAPSSPPRTLAVPAPPPPSPGRQVRAPEPCPGGRALDGRLVAKRLPNTRRCTGTFRGLYPVGARRGRGGSQGRVVEGEPACCLTRGAALCAQAPVAGATCPAASWECAAALRPARILITRGRGAAERGRGCAAVGGATGGPGRGGQQGRERRVAKRRADHSQLGIPDASVGGSSGSSLAGPTAECLCFLRSVPTHPQFPRH